VDIVALPVDPTQPALVAEVKRQRKNFKPELLHAKATHLQAKILHSFEIHERVFTLDDM
jgi:hypothetical protein